MKACRFLLALSGLIPLTALAHTGVGHTSGFWAGVGHPFSGADHMLAMIAVGLWAAQMGGRALWTVPAAFVGLMLVGGGLAMAGVALPLVEQGILVSVMVLGVMIAAAFRLPVLLSVLIVGFFAIFHGHAHGTEMPSLSGAVSYSLGFALSTVSLHVGGALAGIRLEAIFKQSLIRIAGMAIALGGIYLSIA